MRVYFDTGFFIDYFIERGHSRTLLRTADRRGRTTQKLCEDAYTCVVKVGQSHQGITSALTLVEAETTLFDALQKVSADVPEKYRYMISAARAQAVQVMTAVKLHSIQVYALSEDVLKSVLTTLELQQYAIRAADAAHVATAALAEADIIISTDKQILGLDDKIKNRNGVLMRCVDTDDAIAML